MSDEKKRREGLGNQDFEKMAKDLFNAGSGGIPTPGGVLPPGLPPEIAKIMEFARNQTYSPKMITELILNMTIVLTEITAVACGKSLRDTKTYDKMGNMLADLAEGKTKFSEVVQQPFGVKDPTKIDPEVRILATVILLTQATAVAEQDQNPNGPYRSGLGDQNPFGV